MSMTKYYDLLTGEPVPVEYVRRTSSERVVNPHLVDERDLEIFTRRAGLVADHAGIQSGDWVVFADGTERRVSHVWEWGNGPESVQTSDGGSWYLGDGYASFSGGLYPGIKPETLTATSERRDGSCWIFHHNMSGAGRGIEGMVPFRVWTCSEPANR